MTARGPHLNPTTVGVNSGGLQLPMLRAGNTDTLQAADFAGCGTAIIAAVANQPGVEGDGKNYQIFREGSNYNVGGETGKTGGGGRGASAYKSNAGVGSAGTCFSGGSGGGGSQSGSYGWSEAAELYAGKGGNYLGVAGGGTGNPGGTGYNGNVGGTGTAGVIILIVGGNLTIGATGKIETNGLNGGNVATHGGGGGGGIVLALYKGTLTNNGTIEANGGYINAGAGWVCVEQVD